MAKAKGTPSKAVRIPKVNKEARHKKEVEKKAARKIKVPRGTARAKARANIPKKGTNEPNLGMKEAA